MTPSISRTMSVTCAAFPTSVWIRMYALTIGASSSGVEAHGRGGRTFTQTCRSRTSINDGRTRPDARDPAGHEARIVDLQPVSDLVERHQEEAERRALGKRLVGRAAVGTEDALPVVGAGVQEPCEI